MPPAPVIKGLVKPIPQAAGVGDYVAWSLHEMGGAVVVVEGDMPLPLSKLPSGLQVLQGKLRLFQPRMTLATDFPVAPWMDTSRIMSGPNVAQKIYPLGWGY